MIHEKNMFRWGSSFYRDRELRKNRKDIRQSPEGGCSRMLVLWLQMGNNEAGRKSYNTNEVQKSFGFYHCG